ncbi:MAG: hypothetical protein B6I31_05130 [Desulfobacteraceae bacterium 4572_19]|nr:MAG: hypothetical protein B6I31_05130 [Desulfobacteraceae bacterium 4572_19]
MQNEGIMQAKTDKGNKSPNNTENHKKNYRNSKKRQISPTYILKCASVLFAVFFILLSCLILIYPNTDNARKIIQTQINKAIPGSIAFEKLHFSLFSGSLELENISLMDLSNKKIADIKRIFIEVSWKSLLQNEIYIKTAEIVKPQIQLVIGKKGQINLESAFISPEQAEPSSNKPEKSEKLAFNIILKKFELSDGQLNCQIPDKQFIGKIPDINFNISNFNLNNLTGLLALKTDKGSFQTPDIKGIIKKCQLNATLKDGKIKPLFLNLGTTGLNIELSGAINNLLKNSNTQPNLALKIKTDISLSEINKMIIKNNANTQLPLRKINGNIKLVASILGNINRPVIKIDLQGKQFIFQDITIGDMGIYASFCNLLINYYLTLNLF